LKERTAHSPGIITFTHNEAVRGLPAKSQRVQSFLAESTRETTWLFGVHIQGDCSHFNHWPLEPWQSFIMWPETAAPFLANVPRTQLLDLNCIHFMPPVPPAPAGMQRNVDICVISRPSSLKRIHETLLLVRGLMDARPGFTATIIAADPRHIELGVRCYQRQGIDRRFFELPRRLFTSTELKRLSFLCSSSDAFGQFPLTVPLMNDILHRSRFLLLTSHQEGTPRVIVEALQAGTPCILSAKLSCGIRSFLDSHSTLFIPDDIPQAVSEIHKALAGYDRFIVDTAKAHDLFGATRHVPILRSWLEDKIRTAGKSSEGRWFLDDLHLRLACHGEKHNSQFMNRDEFFFDWLDKIDSVSGSARPDFDPYDEDLILGTEPIVDEAPSLFRQTIGRIRG